jgi:hypothetical protein
VLAASLIFAALAWQRFSSGSGDDGSSYVPAQMDEQGEIIPGHFE